MLKAPGKSSGQTGTEILLEAMSKDKVHLARFVLDALDGEIVDSKTESAQTPLISSVLLPDGRTRCKFAELLLQRGASVNCQDGTGRTALSYACEKGYLDAVKILVRNNADPEIVDSWGNTALMYAAVAGHSPVVEFLVRAFKRLGLQIDRQNKVGNSAIEVAKFLGHTDCISALTHNPKKSREADGGAQGNTTPGTSLEDEFESKVGNLANKLEALQTRNQPPVQNWQPRPSMDSIEEFEAENEGSSSPPQDQVLSGASTPAPPPLTYNHPPNSKHSKPNSADHLPPLTQSCEAQKSVFFSPQPNRNTNKPSSPSAPSALSVLLTPLLARKTDTELGAEKPKMPDFGERAFHASYYQKRCSLPTSMLSPAPLERTLVPPRKSRTVRRRDASPNKADSLQVTAPAAASAATTFSVLSNKLLRRFTSPEFKKELEEDPGRIPLSETFPQSTRHPQVDSKPSVDSISSVKCEFDFNSRKTNS
nr:PREDICTED: inversin-A-like [Stegastes partitus]